MQNNDNNELNDKIIAVKKMTSINSAKALSIAVSFTVTAMMTGCSAKNDQSYIAPNGYFGDANSSSSSYNGNSNTIHSGYHGGGYYYFRGGSYRAGSWSNNDTTFKSANAGKSSYKSGGTGVGGKSVGIGG